MNISANMQQYSKCLAIITVISGLWVYRKLKKQCQKPQLVTKVVIITGCDSGLGYSMALYCHNLGMVVCATVLNPNGKVTKELQQLGETTGRLVVIHVDVTVTSSVQTAVKQVSELLEKNKSLGRIINISSHCALAGLPGLSVYAGTKAGLLAWSDALRIEMSKFGVHVISFIPGSFVTQTSILSNQSKYAEEMAQSMEKDVYKYYKDYFHRFNGYLSFFSEEIPVTQVIDNTLYTNLNDALLSCNPKSHYVNSPFRYSFYHFLFSISPVWLRDKLVQKFVSLPKWNK